MIGLMITSSTWLSRVTCICTYRVSMVVKHSTPLIRKSSRLCNYRQRHTPSRVLLRPHTSSISTLLCCIYNNTLIVLHDAILTLSWVVHGSTIDAHNMTAYAILSRFELAIVFFHLCGYLLLTTMEGFATDIDNHSMAGVLAHPPSHQRLYKEGEE